MCVCVCMCVCLCACVRACLRVCVHAFLQVVAREIDTAERRSSTATVTLNILDMNDNAPNFTHPQYLFTVSEDASVDDSIGEILVSKKPLV